jgi:hypothetical protein
MQQHETYGECWEVLKTSAVGFLGPAVADELCKSVEVHSSDSGDMAQSVTIAKLQCWELKFSHGSAWTLHTGASL